MSAFKFKKEDLTAELPYVPFEAFKGLAPRTAIPTVVDSVGTYKGFTQAYTKYDNHLIRVTLWGYSIEAARSLVGKPLTVVFKGYNDAGFPELYAKL